MAMYARARTLTLNPDAKQETQAIRRSWIIAILLLAIPLATSPAVADDTWEQQQPPDEFQRDCPPIPPSDFWSNTLTFPDDSFIVPGSSSDLPGWVKFTILACDEPFTQTTPVYFQDSEEYPFHYHFCTELLYPIFGNMNNQEFDDATLYNAGRLGYLGSVLVPPSEGWPPPVAINEYGIEFVGEDPLPRETVRDMFYAVMNAIQADPAAQAYYFPTYAQQQQAEIDREWFASQNPPILISSSARWSTSNVIYSEGWALGTLKYFEGTEIQQAYLEGRLRPEDILLTDGVPAEVPFVAGILTLSPSTPNSHVAILAQTFGIPFAYLALDDDVRLAQRLLGRRIALRAYGKSVRMINASSITERQYEEILKLKRPPALAIQPMQPYGAISASTTPLVPADICFFGGKSANFGMIRRALPDRSPVATAFSFDLWNGFQDQMMDSGVTLREEIAHILRDYTTWPPADMEALADDLQTIRNRIINDAVFSPAFKQAIIETLQDPQYGFTPYAMQRFRSSTNMEDSEFFTGAGLYESYSGCLGDELDGDSAFYHSAWPCAAAIGEDDVHAWSLSLPGDTQASYTSVRGDVGNPGTFASEPCPSGACCVNGACIDTTHTECMRTYGGSYRGHGTSCETVTCPEVGDGLMRITEYMYSGEDGEFIEFTNVGTEPIDMTGWSYDDESGTPGSVDLSEFGTVAPGESVILTEAASTTFATQWNCHGVTIIGGLTVNLGRNDAINLYDSEDQLVDRLGYGDEAYPGSIRTREISGWPCDMALGEDNVYAWSLSEVGDPQSPRLSAGGDLGSPGVFVSTPCRRGACCANGVCIETTPRECISVHGGAYQGDGVLCEEVSCPPSSTGMIRITEYMSRGNGGEFIEFTNLGARPIDMTGWSYDDESGIPGTVDLSGFGVVAPGQSVILTEDLPEVFAETWLLPDVTIIGGLTVNLGRNDAINLYDASNNLVDRLTYQDAGGPSQCDPDKADERSIFQALRQVFASFYADNAFMERLRHSVDETTVGMGVLSHHSFPDKIELANGVGTLTVRGGSSADLTLVTQVGATSVTNPEGGALPEEMNVWILGSMVYPSVVRYSNLLPRGETVLEFDAEYIELAQYLMQLADEFETTTGKTAYVLDFEYKKVAPGGAALPQGGLVVKQIRELPQPSNEKTITPFLLNEPTEFVVHQGEYGTVFGLHYLKCRLILQTRNTWMTKKALSKDIYAYSYWMYRKACEFHALRGPLSTWPLATYAFEVTPYGGAATNAWSLTEWANRLQYWLHTQYMPMLVAPSESPILTIRDFAYLLEGVYKEPMQETEAAQSTTAVQLRLKDKIQAGDELQERLITDPHAPGLVVRTRFYWPPNPGAAAGYTAPLIRWEETVIEGVTSDPIVLEGYYSQTYRPMHHNFTENFLFEPRLEPGISQDILAELMEMDIQMIHVSANRFTGEGEFTFLGWDGTPCEPCTGSILHGDVNRDGLTNGEDISGFVEELLRPTGWTPSYCAADMDKDRLVDTRDIDLFMDCLLAQ